MSKAITLAEQCGMALSRGGNGYWDNKAQLVIAANVTIETWKGK